MEIINSIINITFISRLFLLELVKGEHEFERAERFRKMTSYTDQIPFSFGNVNWDITET